MMIPQTVFFRLAFLLKAVGVLLCILLFSLNAEATTHIVTFECCEYVPASFQASVGDTVTWQGNFSEHPLQSTTIPGGAAPFSSSSGTSFSYVIQIAGTYNYHCTAHEPAMAGSFNAQAVPTTYTWSGGSAGNWGTAANWTPPRTSPATDDILVFNTSSVVTLDFTSPDTIGQLQVTNGSYVVFTTGAVRTLNIAGGAGIDLMIGAGSALVDSANFAITISLPTGSTGSVAGTFAAKGISSATGHKLIAVDTGSIVFQSGGACLIGSNFSSNIFGTTALNSVVFASGSVYAQVSGSNPFGAGQPNSVVVFQPGSLFRLEGNITPSFSGRTYADFELNVAASISPSGGNPVSVDNLTITQGTLNFNMTGNPGHAIKGNISIAPGATLTFSPASAGTVNLNGTSTQSISGTGTLTTTSNASFVVNNPSGITLSRDFPVNGTLNLTSGVITTDTNRVIIGSTGSVVRTNGHIVGNLQKSVAAGSPTVLFEVGGPTGYRPVELSFSNVGTPGSVTAAVSLAAGDHPAIATSGIDPTKSVNRYWTLTNSGTVFDSCSATLTFIPGDVDGAANTGNFIVKRYDSPDWFSTTVGARTDTSTQAGGITSFSDLAIGEAAQGGGGLAGTKTIPGDYATIAAAIADLNAQGVGSGGVTFNVAAGHTETSSNIVVAIATNQPTVSNTVVFQKSGSGANPLITAAPGVSTSLDGIIKLSGTDYITFNGIDLLDPPSNADFTTMMEWGFALLRRSTTDGCQNVVIKNCAVTLQKANIQSSTVFSIGIFVANRDTNGTTVNATEPAGQNSNNRLFGNTISNVVVGIRFLAPSTSGQRDFNNEVGVIGEAPNTITNFSGSGTTANAEGIRIEGQMNVKVNNNVISGGVGHVYITYGILITSGGSNPGTGNYEIAYNTVTLLTSPSSYTQYAIRALANGDTVRIHHNIVENSNISASTSASFWGIAHDPVGNPATNLSLIYDNIIRNNTLGGTSGALVSIQASGSSGSVPNISVYDNQIYGNQKTGSGSLYGVQGGNASISCYSNLVYNNSSGGTVYGYINSATSVVAQSVYSNTVYNLSGNTIAYGIYITTSSTNTTPRAVYGNTVYGISATGNGTAVGIYQQYGGACQYYQNNIYNVSTAATDTSNFAAGIVVYNVLGTAATTVHNNFISDIRAPNSGNRNGVVGINGIGSSSGSSISAYYNSIYLNATSSGTNFGSSGISAIGNTSATNAMLDLRNNIVVNLSTANGTGVTTALRRLTNVSLNNYSPNSNNNCLYAGTPSFTRLIYFDGTNRDSLIADYQTRVTPRDIASFSAMPPFMNTSTTPYDLHIDTTANSAIESGGTVIGSIETDIDGQPRFGAPGYTGNGTAPDVGADEFEGQPLLTMVYVSSTTTQDTNAVFANSTNNPVVGIQVVTTGFSDPLTVMEFVLNTNGSTNAAGDIANAKVFYTGTSNVFSTALQFGSTHPSPPPAPTTYTITGSQPLVNGTNYFWLTYDIKPTATGGNVVDGEVPSITISSVSRVPTVTAPAGNRTIISALSGVYTISPGQPYPFNSFTSVAGVLGTAGVAGPTMFNVQPGSGPYNEQVEFTAISGASSTNTVTINGNGETITFAPTTANRHIIKLNGAQWMTIDSLVVVGTSADFGWGVHLINAANHNTIRKSVIDLSAVTSTTQSNSAGIVASGSTTSVTATGNNANYCVFTDNDIRGGSGGGPWQGVRLNGNTGGADAVGNQLVNNTIRDFYAEGVTLSNCDTTLVRGNDINRARRVTVTIFQGITLNAGCRNVRMEANRIHSTNDAATNQSTTAYGIYFNSADAPLGGENVAVNNMMYKFNSATGIVHGIRSSASDGAHCFYNSISLDHAGSTAGETRGFYQLTAATNLQFRNNIVSITRGGTGTKHCIYLGASASDVVSNHNLLTINAPAGSNYTGFLTTNYATLANWQTTGHDANSVTGDPQFIALDNLHINPEAAPPSPANAVGTPIAGITEDFDGDIRHLTTPDIGADEFEPTVGVKEKDEIPTVFGLDQNYPNPFNPSTVIRYSLPVVSHVTLRVYNVLGQEVIMLVNREEKAGHGTVAWNGRNSFGNPVGSGLYFYRIEARPIEGGNAFVQIKKMILMK
jgi:plastocyanin